MASSLLLPAAQIRLVQLEFFKFHTQKTTLVYSSLPGPADPDPYASVSPSGIADSPSLNLS